MRTAVSIPDDVFADAERLANALNKSRSQLYSEAVQEYVAKHSPDDVTETLNRVCADVGTEDDCLASDASPRTLKRTDW